MLAKNLQRAIIKRGGTAAITERHHAPGLYELSGQLGEHDVHMYLANGGQPDRGGNSYFTTRHIKHRGAFDPGSDYNPGGYTFCDRIKDLDWATS